MSEAIVIDRGRAARPLYVIGDDLTRLNALLDECEGDFARAEEIQPAVTEWFDRLAEEQATKLDNYVGLLKTLDMEAAAAKAEAEQWAAKAKARERRAEFLRGRLLDYLTRTGQPRAETATGRVLAVVNNGGQLPVVLADSIDPAALPVRFVRYRAEVNKAAVAEALAAGEKLDFATLGQRGVRLKIG